MVLKLFFLLPLISAYALSDRCSGGAHREPCVYKPDCTTNTERMFHVKLFYNRKKGIAPEEFNQYWAYTHAPLAEQFHLRLGAYKYAQYHSTAEFRDLALGRFPIIEYDGAAKFWVPRIETLEAMMSDKEHLTKISPDEKNFTDGESMKMLIGVDYVVVESGGELVTEHGRQF